MQYGSERPKIVMGVTSETVFVRGGGTKRIFVTGITASRRGLRYHDSNGNRVTGDCHDSYWMFSCGSIPDGDWPSLRLASVLFNPDGTVDLDGSGQSG